MITGQQTPNHETSARIREGLWSAAFTALKGSFLKDPLCASVEAGILCAQPMSAHTAEAARGDVGMDHDFVKPVDTL